MTLNYSTTVPVAKTVGEVQAMLARHGADAVTVQYRDQQPSGVAFSLTTPHGARSFAMPVDVDAVGRLLSNLADRGSVRSMSKDKLRSREHAARVAWRVVKDWLEAQLAIIEAQMASIDQVMLPYLVVDDTAAGQVTLYEAYRTREQRALDPGGDPS